MIFRKETIYFSLIILASIISLTKSGLIAYFLSPTNFGYFSIFLILTGYFQYSQLGILNGLGRELPISLGKKDDQRSEILIGTAKKTLIISQSIVSFILILILVFISFDSEIYNLIIFFALITSWISNFFQLSMLRLRSELRIIEFSLINFLVSFLGLILTIYFSIIFGLTGAILGTSLVLFVGYFYTEIFQLKSIKTKKKIFDKDFFLLLKVGFPMLVGAFLQTTLFSLDKVLILNFYSVEKLGLYSFASIPLIIGIGMSGIISTYFYPKILHQFGKDNNKFEAYKISRNISFILIGLGLLVFPLFYLLVNYLLSNFFLEYIEIMNILLFFYFPALLIASNTFGATLMASGQIFFIFLIELILLIITLPIFIYLSLNNFDLIYFPVVLFFLLLIAFFISMLFAKKKSLTEI